jgi:hypothetical protein
LSAFFAKFLAKLQVQRSTRTEFRKEVEPQISTLVSLIDQLSIALEQKLDKPVLIAIDDLDKIKLEAATKLFEDFLVNLEKLGCYVIYTVPVALMHKPAWTNLHNRAWYIPNIKLHAKNDCKKKDSKNYKVMREFVAKRMETLLIAYRALDTVITYGGGVFRQTCRLMQVASDFSIDRGKSKVDTTDVQSAIAEETNSILSQLTTEHLVKLKEIARDNTLQLGFESAELLHNLSLLRYPNDEDWHDVNPLLWERIKNFEPSDDNQE